MVSLCLLAYKRPEQLKRCFQSLRETADYPYELIINLDGGDEYNLPYVTQLIEQGLASKVILNSGKNRGVGRSFQNCIAVAEGDYIFKIDTDLIFKANWLSKAVKILKNNPDVGAVTLFDYNNYDPNDGRFKPSNNTVEERPDCWIVLDFVSSIYGFKKEGTLITLPMPDDGFHQSLGKLAMTKEDYVINNGFGVYKSTYVSGTEENPFKTPTSDEPLVFLSGLEPA